jgi:hypothetical protein
MVVVVAARKSEAHRAAIALAGDDIQRAAARLETRLHRPSMP